MTDHDQHPTRASFRRPSWRAVGAVLAATAVLAAGADTVSYAATGKSLLLGMSNGADRTTSVTNTGSGAALSLKSRSSSAPLAVSNSKLVKGLNADLLDGKSLESVSPTMMRALMPFTSGSKVNTTKYFQTTKIPAGRYEIASSGIVVPDTGASYRCLFLDYTKLDAGDYSGIYLLKSVTSDSQDQSMSQQSLGTVVAGHQLVYGCSFSGGDSTVYTPVTFTLRKVSALKGVTGQAPFTPRAGARSLRPLTAR